MPPYQELSASLLHFDKRTIELLLTRAEKYPPPSHLGDLGIAGLMETSGRERRHRYFTVASYKSLVAKEQLDQSTAGYAEVDLSNVGGFLPVDQNLLYADEAALFKYQDAFKDSETIKVGRKKSLTNPILPDGSIKQGRPRKYPVNEDGMAVMANGKLRRVTYKRKREVDDDTTVPAASVPPVVTEKPARKKRRINSGNVDTTSHPQEVVDGTSNLFLPAMWIDLN